MEITPDFSKVQLYIGIDVHKRQWTVTIQAKDIHHRTFSQQPTPEALKTYLDKWLPTYQTKVTTVFIDLKL